MDCDIPGTGQSAEERPRGETANCAIYRIRSRAWCHRVIYARRTTLFRFDNNINNTVRSKREFKKSKQAIDSEGFFFNAFYRLHKLISIHLDSVA